MKWVKIIVTVLVIGLAGPVLYGESIDHVTSLLWTGLSDIQANGNVACCNFVNGVMLLDISDPSAPELINRMPMRNRERQIFYAGNYLYVAEGNYDLEIYDISNVADPYPLSNFDTQHAAKDVKVFGNYAYLTTQWLNESSDTLNEIIVIDISDRSNPVEVSRFNAYFHLTVRDIYINDDIAFITYSGNRLIEGYNIPFGGLAVFDLSDPTTPILTADSQTFDTGYRNVYADGNQAYVTHNTNGLMIYSTFYPSFVFLDTNFAVDGYARDVQVKDNYAYVSAPGVASKMYVIDISNPSNPVLQSIYNSEDYISSFSINGDYIFTGDFRSGIGVVDISNPDDLIRVGSYDIPYSVLNTYLSGDLAFVTLDNSGLQIVDVANPAQPVLFSSYNSNGRHHNVSVLDDYAYIADFSSGLEIVDISDPHNPELAGSYPLQYEAHNLAIIGNYAFVAAGIGGLQVINIEDRSNPEFVSSLTFQGYAQDICVDGGYAYVPGDAFGLRIIDISNPAQPLLSGTFNSPSSATAVAVAGMYAYLADGSGGGFYVINIADPSNPVEVGHLMLGGTASDVFLSDGYAFVASGDFYAIDIADPLNPTIAAAYETPYRARGVYADGDYVYVADEASLIILHFDSQVGIGDKHVELPEKATLYQNYPNPFNNRTVIEYTLPEAAFVTIDIFDLMGRKVTSLVNNQKSAGYYRVLWDAEEVSSGMYFYKIQAGDFAESKKMTLIK
jgi:hypothetical protein